ncbi:hypothetical protein FNF27_03732 [Cafeteria roenbergensis]|uniref:Uncharacterized protein n=1 Tax=Cafeteria roenbergensis TaxID=33653 RepID=A0A5A8EDQ3_CAFRO|nr:hypothetical protein FNF27_03732 [Cafeteria roenbergensis]
MAAMDVADDKVNQLASETILKGIEGVLLHRLEDAHLERLGRGTDTRSESARFGLTTPRLDKLRADTSSWAKEPDRPLTLEVHRRPRGHTDPIGPGPSQSLSERWVFAFARSKQGGAGDAREMALPSGKQLISELRKFHLAASVLLRSVFAIAVTMGEPAGPPDSPEEVSYRLLASHPSRESPHAASFPDAAMVRSHQLQGSRSSLGALIVTVDIRTGMGSAAGPAALSPSKIDAPGQNLSALLRDAWFTERGGAVAPSLQSLPALDEMVDEAGEAPREEDAGGALGGGEDWDADATPFAASPQRRRADTRDLLGEGHAKAASRWRRRGSSDADSMAAAHRESPGGHASPGDGALAGRPTEAPPFSVPGPANAVLPDLELGIPAFATPPPQQRPSSAALRGAMELRGLGGATAAALAMAGVPGTMRYGALRV